LPFRCRFLGKRIQLGKVEFSPAAAANTIFARNTSRAGVLRPRDHFINALRSSAVNKIETATRIV